MFGVCGMVGIVHTPPLRRLTTCAPTVVGGIVGYTNLVSVTVGVSKVVDLMVETYPVGCCEGTEHGSAIKVGHFPYYTETNGP